MWYYRDKESKEVDMIMERDGMVYPIEIKNANPEDKPVHAFENLDKGSVPRGKGAIICMRAELSAINADNYIIPVWMI